MTENTRPLRDFFQSLPSGSPVRLVGSDLTTINVADLVSVGIDGVQAGQGIEINPADPRLPLVSLDGQSIYQLSLAESAVQPEDLGGLATKNKISVPGDIDASGSAGPLSYLRGDGVWATTPLGSVTSVGVSVPLGLSVSGSPVTEAGTIAISHAPGYQGFTVDESVKLSGVQVGATANQTDAYLLNRDNHTGSQAISTVTGLQTTLDGKALQGTTIGAGAGLTGGGTLAANRTIALNGASIASLALADTAVQPSDLGDLAYIDFPASPSGNVLNDSGNWVPQGGGGGGGGQVNSVSSGTGIYVDSTDPINPVVSLSSASVASLGLADTAVQPTDLGDSASLDVGTVAGTVAAGNHTHADATTSDAGFMSAADKAKLNGISAGATDNTGTVTSVGINVPTGLSVSGSPVTSSGNISISYTSGYQGYTASEASKLAGIQSGAQVNTVTSVSGKTGAVTLTKGDVGLGNVDNTSDANKPVSTATQTALNGKANATVTISAGAGLEGGGSLSANRTVSLSSASIASIAKADTALQPESAFIENMKDELYWIAVSS